MAGQQFCGEDWSKLKKKYRSLKDEDLLRYCFSSAYIVALLHDSLGVSLDDEGYVPLVATGFVKIEYVDPQANMVYVIFCDYYMWCTQPCFLLNRINCRPT